MRKKIKIIGCGVSGLTVGITLLEAGYEVEIITDKLPKETTSATAAAIWFPYEVKPKEKANKWSKESYNKFVAFCKEPNAGVSMIAITVLVKAEKDAWWIDALPEGAIRKAKKEEVPPQFPIGFVANVPLTETQLYLDFLLEQFKSLNGQLTLRKVSTLSELDDSNSIIVNCAGLGSRELVNDQTMYAIQGQIVKAKPQANINCIAADFIFGDTHDKVAYVVPRKDCIVLGGTAMVGKEDLTPDPALTKGILERCTVLEPNLKNIEVQSVAVGLRPGRPEIRLERVGNIIHNYGHGGGGFTVSWGCAMEVKRLIEEG